LTDARPEINWKNIARFRDIVVHHYFRIDMDVVWDIVLNKIVPLEEAVSYLYSLEQQ